MLSLSRCLGSKQARKVLNPGSSLLNPRSGRARLRQAMAAHQNEQEFFDQQALFADIGGSSQPGAGKRLGPRGGGGGGAKKSKFQRKSYHVLRVGAEVADRAKHMTDSEWESVSMEDKHAFAKYMNKLLQERPTEASEQQRRRYFETTMVDPRDMDPNRTVHDEYERLKLGLPVQLKNPRRSLGVSQALYDSADASLFDPANVHKLENAMTQVKQVFADYMQKRRAGTSTEHERRQLANLTAHLNVETQKHLANMFKYTEEKIRHAALEERQAQLKELERLKGLLADSRGPSRRHRSPDGKEGQHTQSNADLSHEGVTQDQDGDEVLHNHHQEQPGTRHRRSRRRLSVAERKAKLTKSISKAIGLDLNVVQSLLTELDAQERFMQFCEVFARLTVGTGFTHSSSDETLDAYVDSLKKLYSVDPQKLSTLDVVQYMAAKEEAAPVEWARRWYERALLVPLQQTPEYQRLQEIQEADKAALALQRSLREAPQTTAAATEEERTAAHTAPPQQMATGTSERTPDAGTTAALEVSTGAAHAKQDKVVRLVEKMFLRPDDPRLETLHEKRLRYLAYLQMERQIAQARENAKLFSGVEHSAEAAECRELYQRLLDRKAKLAAATTAAPPHTTTEEVEETEPGREEQRLTHDAGSGDGEAAALTNVFAADPEAAELFEQIRDITNRVIARTLATGQERGQSGANRSTATKAAARARAVAALLKSIQKGANDTHELQAILAEKKSQVTRRLLGVVERDVQAELDWLEAMQEAERPPLLPVPEGMSYVSASEVAAWRTIREEDAKKSANPFTKKQRVFQPALLGQTWSIPDKPMLFWGTGTKAVQQALQHAAEDASRKRRGEPLAPPYPCPENPWGWRLVKDILDD